MHHHSYLCEKSTVICILRFRFLIKGFHTFTPIIFIGCAVKKKPITLHTHTHTLLMRIGDCDCLIVTESMRKCVQKVHSELKYGAIQHSQHIIWVMMIVCELKVCDIQLEWVQWILRVPSKVLQVNTTFNPTFIIRSQSASSMWAQSSLATSK